jgi:hypothetical protein
MPWFIPFLCRADTAQVPPKGVFFFDATYYHYFDITKEYNEDGNVEKLGKPFSAELTSDIFTDLKAIDALFQQGGIPARANLGRSDVDITLKYRWNEFTFGYGMTDKPMIEVLVPFLYSKVEVDARLDSATATVGFNDVLNSPFPFAPFPQPPGSNIRPFTAEDIQNLLVNQFGFKKLETWSDSGFGDIELLAKYQFYNKAPWRLAAAGGVRLPTGRADDPDNLVDIPFGDDQTDFIFRFYADYLRLKRLALGGVLRYEIQFPDAQELRVPEVVDLPITANKEVVDRNLGDAFEAELYGVYNFTPEIFGALRYRFTRKFKDDIDGRRGFAYSTLEEESDIKSHMGFIDFGISTIDLYLNKKFPVPLTFMVTYRNRFAGENATRSQFIAFDLTIFFKGPWVP